MKLCRCGAVIIWEDFENFWVLESFVLNPKGPWELAQQKRMSWETGPGVLGTSFDISLLLACQYSSMPCVQGGLHPVPKNRNGFVTLCSRRFPFVLFCSTVLGESFSLYVRRLEVLFWRVLSDVFDLVVRYWHIKAKGHGGCRFSVDMLSVESLRGNRRCRYSDVSADMF